MKISELIKELERAKEQHGDLDVLVFDNEIGYDAASELRLITVSSVFDDADQPNAVSVR